MKKAGRYMKHVDIYTDGACRGNPGKGGWGAILVFGSVEKELSGGGILMNYGAHSLDRIFYTRLSILFYATINRYWHW